jgi:hypothetical protein
LIASSIPLLEIVSPPSPTTRFTYSRPGASGTRNTMTLPRTGVIAATATRSPTAIVGTIESPAVYVF